MDKEDASVAFDRIIQAGRQKKKHEKLAQEIFGQRRASTPNSSSRPNLSSSLSSRVGVSKQRPASLSRASSSQSRITQQATQQRRGATNGSAPRQNNGAQQARPHQSNRSQHSNQRLGVNVQSSDGAGMNIKGAAANGPIVLVASNFEKGTTAADIESVMLRVTEDLTYCELIQSSPNVMAEMGFADRKGAELVINTFDKKKADGRVLYVSYKEKNPQSTQSRQPRQQQALQQPEEEEVYDGENAMEVDENAQAREAENKIREERRGGGDRSRQDVTPSGPRRARANFSAQDDYQYNNNNQSAQWSGPSSYQDGRYGFSSGRGGGYGNRGGYYGDRRNYGQGGSQWRQ